MYDFSNIHSHRDNHARGIENAVKRGEGKKLDLVNKAPVQTHAPRRAPETESLDLHSSARKLLNDQVIQSLNDMLIEPKMPIRDLDPAEFTPKAVADRILNFVGNAVEQRRDAGESNEAVKKMLAAARSGIEKGFAEAKDALTNLGIYQDNVKRDADQTHALLNEGLNGFDNNLAEGVALLPKPDTGHVQFSHSTESYAERQSTSLQIKTRDGDLVTININKSEGYSASQSAYQDNNSRINSSELSYNQSQGLQFTVEGDLDKDELKAINNLVGEVKGLSDNFFNGDTQAALNHATDIGFDSSEIAGFTFNMSHSQTSTATQAYAEVRELNNPQSAPVPERQLANLLAPLADIMKDLRQLLNQADKMFDPKDSHHDVKNLFDSLSLMDEGKHGAINKLEDLSHQPFDQYSKQIFDSFM